MQLISGAPLRSSHLVTCCERAGRACSSAVRCGSARFGAVRRGSARFGAARQAIFAMETAWERWKIEADPSRTVKTQKFGIRHKGEEFTPADNIPRYVGVCHAKGQGCPGLVVFKVGKPTYVCGTATCKLQWQVQHGFKGPQRETPPEELAAVAGGGHGDAAAAAVSQPGHTEATFTLAALEKAAAKLAAAAMQAAGMGPGSLERKFSLPSENGALQQNAQIMQSLCFLPPPRAEQEALRNVPFQFQARRRSRSRPPMRRALAA